MTADRQSTSKILVNGSLLPQFVSKTVTLFGTVNYNNPNGTSFDILTSDKQVVTVIMRKALVDAITGLVEVHGIVRDKNTVICNYHLVFPPEISSTYDADLLNDTVKVIHSIPNIWANSL